jgi:adenine-specific DNA-methyltransferase
MKLDLQTPDFVAENAARLAELFPNCVTETKQPDGTLKRAIDFDLLRQELSHDLVEGPQERYRLDWPGKREALATANAPIRKTLRPCKDESVNFDTTQNLYIEGDNLDALKLLQETYLGKVKMIYIDPPYNTGNDFIYDDNFSISREEYEDLAQIRDEEGNAMFQEEKWKQNSSASGRFHSEWLSMIYPRLKLARNLLPENGFLFISIDEDEIHNLRKVCDEIFGQNNFISIISVENNPKGRKNSKFVSVSSEFLIIYAKNKNYESTKLIENIPKDPNSILTDKNGLQYTPGKRVLVGKSTNPEITSTSSRKHYSAYHNPKTNEIQIEKEEVARVNLDLIEKGFKRYTSERDGVFIENTYTNEEFENLHKQDLLIFKADTIYEKDANCFTRIKSLLVNDKTKNIDLKTETSKKLIDPELQGFFDNPKNVRFLQILITLIPDQDATFLDFFSGSGTTAHAVMQLNAEDGGKRRHIMVQLSEPCDEKSEAYKAGYKTIAEIGKERIRRAGKKILAEWQAKQTSSAENLKLDAEPSAASAPDIGFRVLKIDSSNMADVYYQPDEVTQDGLALQVDNLKPDRKPEDLLFQVLLDWGVDLALPITEETILKHRVFFVADNALAACFDTGLDEALVKELAKRQPLRAVFRDSGYTNDAVKINFEQIFKALSPHTDLKTL